MEIEHIKSPREPKNTITEMKDTKEGKSPRHTEWKQMSKAVIALFKS